MKLFPSLMPREDRFFGLLRSSTKNLVDVSVLLVDLMEHYENVPQKVAEIKRLEEVGDHVIHEIMRNLHRTFVTPIDREDIAMLAERLDDVVDAIEEASRYMVEYSIKAPTRPAIELSQTIKKSSDALQLAIGKLHFQGGKLKEILPDSVEVNRLENEADHITSQAIAHLFNNVKDPIEVMKWRDIYEQLELATDRCEDVANVLEGIVLENG